MKAATEELRDAAGAAVALVTGVAVFILLHNVFAAVAAAAAVVAVKSAAAAVLKQPARPAPSPRGAPGGLTRRELEVAGLIGLGLTNAGIGLRLTRSGGRHVSERGVDAHVQNILKKLGYHSRAQVAAWAEQHDLIPREEKKEPN